MTQPVVHLRGVVALLHRFPALAGVDLDVGEGEIVLLRGPNGAGKTTVLKVCAGLIPVADGTAVVLGHDLRRDRRSVRRSVGLVGHDGFLYDDLTVDDNIGFALRAARASVDRSALDATLAELGLDGRLRHAPVSGLSAGQRRRVSLAAVAARKPPLWLLDEPHAGLDADGRDVIDRLVRLAAMSGASVVFASHELDRAESLATRVVTVAGGHAQRAHADTIEVAGVA